MATYRSGVQWQLLVTIVSPFFSRNVDPLFKFLRENRGDLNMGRCLTWFECTKESILSSSTTALCRCLS